VVKVPLTRDGHYRLLHDEQGRHPPERYFVLFRGAGLARGEGRAYIHQPVRWTASMTLAANGMELVRQICTIY